MKNFHPEADINGLLLAIYLRAAKDYRKAKTEYEARRILSEIGQHDMLIMATGLSGRQLKKIILKHLDQLCSEHQVRSKK